MTGSVSECYKQVRVILTFQSAMGGGGGGGGSKKVYHTFCIRHSGEGYSTSERSDLCIENNFAKNALTARRLKCNSFCFMHKWNNNHY